MQKRFATRCLAFTLLALTAASILPGFRADATPAPKASVLAFPVSPHDNVSIEWWYLNAHVMTLKKRHLSVIASFFRLGDGRSLNAGRAKDRKTQSIDQHSHYLIYAVTDEDARTHQAYSLADTKSLGLMQQAASLVLLRDPNNKDAQNLLALSSKNKFPPPTVLIAGVCKVSDSPNFSASYGSAASVSAVPGRSNTFELAISPHGTGPGLHLDLIFAASRLPMYVGGTGNTGVARPEDMKYVSLTRCAVTGTIGTGAAAAPIAGGTGWFDHQWGNSWTPQAVGWDWWGVQLGDGLDILFYRMRRMHDGSIFSSLATIEDPSGAISVTHNLVFTPDPRSLWTSPMTHITYPLKWKVDLPDENLELTIGPNVQDQEMPVLASGGAIWEGSVFVDSEAITDTPDAMPESQGMGYQELVGYGSPVVAKTLPAPIAPKP